MERLKHYFPKLNDTQMELYAQMFDLYSFWNQQINVVSRKDLESFEVHHILHSLAIARMFTFEKGQSVMDVGTGGGLPGIPLAVMFPDTDFLLVDSIGKKIKVVNEISTALGLKNVRAAQARAEDINERFDVITARAVTHLLPLFGFIQKKFKKQNQGLITLKGGDLSEEIHSFNEGHPNASVLEYQIAHWFNEPFFETKKILWVKEH